jgi:hypothetical protein
MADALFVVAVALRASHGVVGQVRARRFEREALEHALRHRKI